MHGGGGRQSGKHPFPNTNRRDVMTRTNGSVGSFHGGSRNNVNNDSNNNNPSNINYHPPQGPGLHPLHNGWKFWYFANHKGQSWEHNLKEVIEISTVEEFWALYQGIKLPSEISVGMSYFFFKSHLKPMWEDEGNRHGGRWLMTFDKQRKEVDEKWLEVLLCVIGEAFGEDGEDLCGVAVDVRQRADKISIWTKDCTNKDRIMNIGQIIKSRLQLGENDMKYERHADTASRPSKTAHLHTL